MAVKISGSGGYIQLPQTSSQANASSGTVKVYAPTTGGVAAVDSSGNVSSLVQFPSPHTLGLN